MVGPKQTGSEKKKAVPEDGENGGEVQRGSADLGRLIAIRMEAPSRVSILADKPGSRNPSRANISDRYRRSGKG